MSSAAASTRLVGWPMYDMPETREANETLWKALRTRLKQARVAALPTELTHPDDLYGLWVSKRLLLSQTCGYPLTHRLKGTVQVVGSPVYRIAECKPGEYHSVIVVRRDDHARHLEDLRGRRCATNSQDSHSGYNVLRCMVAPHAEQGLFFSSVSLTGSHERSLRAVAKREADVASIDVVCWELLRKHRPSALAELRILTRSPAAPSLPFIAPNADSAEVGALRTALQSVFQDPIVAAACGELLLSGLIPSDAAKYEPIMEMERKAFALGYPQLA